MKHEPSASKHPSWAGMTIEELRYQRAINLVKMQIMHERLINSGKKLEGSSPLLRSGSIIRTIFSGFSLAQYLGIGVSSAKMLIRLYRYFHR